MSHQPVPESSVLTGLPARDAAQSTGHVRLLASQKTWIEGIAVDQLKKTAQLPGMQLAVGLPDLHPGKGSPIGAAFLTQNWIYPPLVGNDIGCGIGLWSTSLTGKPKRDAWAAKLRHIEGPWEGDAEAWLAASAVSPTGHESSLGTIGSGNHFAELQCIEQIENPDACAELGIEYSRAYLCVHSGSRGLGDQILQEHFAAFGTRGLEASSVQAQAYLERHNQALHWAKANRALISHRILERLHAEGNCVTDVCHNWVEPIDGHWLHRKGAAPSTAGPVVIPGSRGSLSYLVRPVNPSVESAFSLAHGAGRKWSRTDSKARLEKRFSAKDLERTDLGSQVICEDKDLLYEEAPQAYKNITTVIEDLRQAGLLEVLAILRPLVTYKVRR